MQSRIFGPYKVSDRTARLIDDLLTQLAKLDEIASQTAYSDGFDAGYAKGFKDCEESLPGDGDER